MEVAKRNMIIKETIGIFIAFIGYYFLIPFMNFLEHKVIVRSPQYVIIMAILTTLRWIIAIIPLLVMVLSKDTFVDYGFSDKKTGKQVLIGIAGGLCLFLFFFLPVHYILGYGNLASSYQNYDTWWRFAGNYLYKIFGNGLVEELVFRGLFFVKLQRISGKTWIASLGSSILFGLVHVIGAPYIDWLLIQTFLYTTTIGLLFCLLKTKVKDCSTFSLGVAHGVFNATLTVFATLMLRA